MSIDLICLDADDTLWYNMRHFVAAEQALLAMLAPFTRDALTACEARNLPLYGYGAKGFTLSMIETALDLGGDALPTPVVREILAAGRELLPIRSSCWTGSRRRSTLWRRGGGWCW